MTLRHSFSCILITMAFSACEQKIPDRALKTDVDSISYYTGTFTAWTLKDLDYNQFSKEAFYDGLEKALDTTNTEISLQEADYFIGLYLDKFRKRQNERNLKSGEAFLSENEKRTGVKTTTSGLQYEIIREGTGPTPKVNDLVIITHKGSTIDNQIFSEQIQPDTFKLSKTDVIPGWLEGIQLMPKNSKYKFFLPTELAFGDRYSPIPFVKPNMALIYEIELIDIIGH